MFAFYFVSFKFKRPFVDDFALGGGGEHKQMYISLNSKKRRKRGFFWKENTGVSSTVPEGAEIKRVIVRLRSHRYADSHESSTLPVASCKFICRIL